MDRKEEYLDKKEENAKIELENAREQYKVAKTAEEQMEAKKKIIEAKERRTTDAHKAFVQNMNSGNPRFTKLGDNNAKVEMTEKQKEKAERGRENLEKWQAQKESSR